MPTVSHIRIHHHSLGEFEFAVSELIYREEADVDGVVKSVLVVHDLVALLISLGMKAQSNE